MTRDFNFLSVYVQQINTAIIWFGHMSRNLLDKAAL